MGVKKIFIFSAVAACVFLSLRDVPAFSFYEPGLSAAAMGAAGGGAASLLRPEAALNPAAAAIGGAGLSLSSDYRLFYVGIPSERGTIPGYINPSPSEGRLEIIARSADGLAAGAGYYTLILADRFAHRAISFYAAAALDGIIRVSGDERIFAGAAVKHIGLDYGRDEYTPSFAKSISLSKTALTCDAGVVYASGRLSAAFAARNLIPTDLGIYEEWRAPMTFVMAGAFGVSESVELRLDAAAEGSGGFTGITPSAEINMGAARLRFGVSPSQAGIGFGFASGDFSFDAAAVYPYGTADGFADAAAGITYRIK